MDNIIELQNIGRCYDREIGDWALRKITFSVKKNEYVSICGPSGCGKSTLLSILGLVDEPTEGSYSLLGKSTSALNFDDLARLRRQHIGFIFQSFHLIDHLNNAENVALPLILDGKSRDYALGKASALMDSLGLSSQADKKPSQISGGQQQRVSIARALVNNPDLLLIDEPTGNLDSKNSEIVMTFLDTLHEQGCTLILVTHDEAYSNRATRRLDILDGRLVSEPGSFA